MLGLSRVSLLAEIFLGGWRGKGLEDSNATFLLEWDCHSALPYSARLAIHWALSPVLCGLWLGPFGKQLYSVYLHIRLYLAVGYTLPNIAWIQTSPSPLIGLISFVTFQCKLRSSIPVLRGVQISSYFVSLYILHQIPLWRYKYHPIPPRFHHSHCSFHHS